MTAVLMIILMFTLCTPAVSGQTDVPCSGRSRRAIKRVTPRLEKAFSEMHLTLGSPVFMRIFKEESELEVWIKSGEKFVLFRTYKICTFSGGLGPKTRKGDCQAPEGFYFIQPHQMNPASNFHLSFNLGYPNAYDRAHGRTGSLLMVHGDCVSIGCYAMTDPFIEEIWTIADAALRNGQPFFRVHAFPFRMTETRMRSTADSKHIAFWQNLKEGYDRFERTGLPPDVTVKNMRYCFGE